MEQKFNDYIEKIRTGKIKINKTIFLDEFKDFDFSNEKPSDFKVNFIDNVFYYQTFIYEGKMDLYAGRIEYTILDNGKMILWDDSLYSNQGIRVIFYTEMTAKEKKEALDKIKSERDVVCSSDYSKSINFIIN